ncbi:MAG: cation-translocating P-type ATPase [Sphaerochaetaceae bacterium]|jgi:Cd2+/Zn2+-exporting ATPase|nr:cation-translocating P-type ATPase [Sphaerochaetaceae bacterium]HHU89184.1 cation-translocating P-type ATPase [Spirochaetales bacterium]
MSKKGSIILGTPLVLLSFILYKTVGYHLVTIILMLATALLAGGPIIYRALVALRYRVIGIDLLVSIAVVGALAIGEFWEAAAVTYLFMLGDYLESRTLEKSRSSIKSLMALAPETARVREGANEIIVSPQELKRGMSVVIKPGERIAADGVVIEGSAYLDQSSLTGESEPVHKEVGDEVFSGTLITNGYLVIEALKVGEESTFAKIIHLVEEAQDAKAPTQKFIERFSKYYTPAIIAIALITYLITKDIRMALTLLVIGCPGALVISVPVSIVAAIGTSAKLGILLKGGEMVEKLGKVDVTAFDKTGTLTQGKPTVTTIKGYGMEMDELLRLSAIGETYSEHPLGQAIIDAAQERVLLSEQLPEDVDHIQGQGLTFSLEGERYLIGNRALLESHQIDLSVVMEDLARESHLRRSVVLVASAKEVLGLIAISDQVRAEAGEVITQLRSLGVKKSVMLTGDNRATAQAVAEYLNLDEFKAELMPGDKVDEVKQLQSEYGKVALIGDGINDAPSLATADVGIAIAGAGNDVAMESADVVLLGEKLSPLIDAIKLSRLAVANMQQNIFFALAVAAFLLVGVLMGGVTLSVGMLVHELSVLLVILNAVRLMRYAKGKKKTII